jgi:Lipid A 3-O-deacylase (PagL)
MPLPVVHIRVKAVIQAIWIALLVSAGCVPGSASAHPMCDSCEVQIGVGGTYHFWGRTGGVVLPMSLTWSEARYEFAVFRVSSQQTLHDANYRDGHVMAHPYWGLSISRRWRLVERGPVRAFFGFGLAAKNESDQLSVTRLNFASQLGVRFRLPGDRVVAELAVRHWSNGGIRLPNHGQDFATLTVRLNSGVFGVERAELISRDELMNPRGALLAAHTGVEGLP